MTDIIIPAYHAQSSIVKLLNSIACQQCLDQFTVTIVNDSADGDTYADVLKLFPYLQVTELSYAANRGPGYARQYGIDHTSGDYIMFIDADDWLFDCMALYRVHKYKDSSAIVAFDVAMWNTNAFGIIDMSQDRWLHGKVFKREFIQKHAIRFQELSYAEDTIFLQQCQCYTDCVIKHIDKILYVYDCTYNINKLTLSIHDKLIKNKLTQIKCTHNMISSVYDTNNNDNADITLCRQQIVRLLQDIYQWYTSDLLTGIHFTDEYVQELYTALHEFIEYFPDDYDWEANKGRSEEVIRYVLQQNNIELLELSLTFAKFMDNVIHLQGV